MKRVVDVRNMACPGPVIETKKAVENLGPGLVEVITDSDASTENIVKFLGSCGITADVSVREGSRVISFLNPLKPSVPSSCAVSCDTSRTGRSMVISKDRLGDGDDELGRILMRVFLHTLTEAGSKPEKLFFVNQGVRLTTAGSPVIDDLKALAASGVGIYSCGTCLDYYHLKDSLVTGEVGNMYLLIEILTGGGLFL